MPRSVVGGNLPPAPFAMNAPNRMKRKPLLTSDLRDREDPKGPAWQWVKAPEVPQGMVKAFCGSGRGCAYLRPSTCALINDANFADLIAGLIVDSQRADGKPVFYQLQSNGRFQLVPHTESTPDPTIKGLGPKVDKLAAILASGEDLDRKMTVQAYCTVSKEILQAEDRLRRIREKFEACQDFIEVVLGGE